LAQAGVKLGRPPNLPADLPAVLIHGTEDETVPIEDSRMLAASSGARLIEVNDCHRLSSIRQSGVLAEALQFLGVAPVLPETPGAPWSRNEQMEWFSELIAPETTHARREELAQSPRISGTDLSPLLVATLRGLWRKIDSTDALRARRDLASLLLRSAGPDGVVPCHRCGGLSCEGEEPTCPWDRFHNPTRAIS
jgi:hypothetical protein